MTRILALKRLSPFTRAGFVRVSRGSYLKSKQKGQSKNALTCKFLGGDKGVRTPDLMTASHALSQLSYIPVGL